MSEKRFELKVNKHNQCDIIDWEKSEEKNAICIYNDLGDYYFSSAMALCKLLNEFYEKNKDLEEARSYYQENFLTMKTERNQLKEENEQLKIRFKEERDTAMRLGSECDNLTIKNQKLELEIRRLEMIIKTGEKKDEHIGWKRVDVE